MVDPICRLIRIERALWHDSYLIVYCICTQPRFISVVLIPLEKQSWGGRGKNRLLKNLQFRVKVIPSQ